VHIQRPLLYLVTHYGATLYLSTGNLDAVRDYYLVPASKFFLICLFLPKHENLPAFCKGIVKVFINKSIPIVSHILWLFVYEVESIPNLTVPSFSLEEKCL